MRQWGEKVGGKPAEGNYCIAETDAPTNHSQVMEGRKKELQEFF